MVNWLRRMADLYDILDAQRPRDSRLLPLYHSQANAHLEITIHESGEFVDARLLKDSSQNNKDEEQTDVRLTLFPGSPPAISRSSNLTPRGLMDKISYLAGDMDEFLLDDEKGTFSRHNTAYMVQMQEWVESPHSNKTVQAVYHYLQKKCLLHDLAPTVVDLLAKGEFKKAVQDAHEQKQEAALLKQLLKFNEAKQRKNNVKVISDVVVRWCVIPESPELLDLPSNTWERQDIIEDWISFMRDTFLPTAERGFDTIYGEEYVPLVRTWFPWVLSPTCNLSVISSNRGPEQYNFGVYDNASQNFSAGLEPADKALRALRYIIEVQGIRYCDKTGIVGAMAIWANGAKGVTLPFAGIKSSLSLFEENLEATDDAIGHDYSIKIRDALKGVRKMMEQDGTENIGIIEFKKTSTGRVAMTQYEEIPPEQYLASVNRWYETAAWWQLTRQGVSIQTPSIKEISKYGTISAGSMLGAKSNSETFRWQAELVKCIMAGKRIPMYMVQKMAQVATGPSETESEAFYKLGLACSVIAAYNNFSERKFDAMMETASVSRDVLFGRAWAYVEMMSRDYQYFKKGKNGNGTAKSYNTLASRYMNAFKQRPLETLCDVFTTLANVYVPAAPKLKYQLDKLSEIMAEIETSKCCDVRTPLRPEWLLAYSSQLVALQQEKKSRIQAAQEDSEQENESE